MIPVTDFNRIALLLQSFREECRRLDGLDPVVGMAIRPDVFERFNGELDGMPMIKETAAEAQLYGVPYAVHLVAARVVNETGQTVRWAPEVTFFTDLGAWKRFLQHTDD